MPHPSVPISLLLLWLSEAFNQCWLSVVLQGTLYAYNHLPNSSLEPFLFDMHVFFMWITKHDALQPVQFHAFALHLQSLQSQHSGAIHTKDQHCKAVLTVKWSECIRDPGGLLLSKWSCSRSLKQAGCLWFSNTQQPVGRPSCSACCVGCD